MRPDPLIRAEHLSVHFRAGAGRGSPIRAVDDVSLGVRHREVLGLVGESGSGKTTFGRALLRLAEPTAGRIVFEEQDLTGLNRKAMRAVRPKLQMIFQDPYSSINPRLRVRDVIDEPLRVSGMRSPQERLASVKEILDHVQLPSAFVDRLPHELSGGQRQRVAIARALVTRPEFLIADEAVSALDVSVQAQIINLLADLRKEFGLTILMISHDLSVVEYLSDQVAVMYLGKLVEIGSVDQIFMGAAHPYTAALLDSAPEPDPTIANEARPIKGDIPSPANPPSGCVFRTRCPYATDQCVTTTPTLTEVGPGHHAACIRLDEIDRRLPGQAIVFRSSGPSQRRS